MTDNDLQRLIYNLDEDQKEIVSGIVLRIAALKSERWTGAVTFAVNVHIGGIVDMHVNKGEIVRLTKKRGVRSGGV